MESGGHPITGSIRCSINSTRCFKLALRVQNDADPHYNFIDKRRIETQLLHCFLTLQNLPVPFVVPVVRPRQIRFQSPPRPPTGYSQSPPSTTNRASCPTSTPACFRTSYPANARQTAHPRHEIP